jgi:hypothetical protein
MQGDRNGGTGEERHARRWEDVAQLAQQDLARQLSRRLGAGAFDRHRYQNWLAMESATCRICALSLDAVAGWHGSQPELQATATAWAGELRDLAHAAARDVRVLDGMASAPPPALARWHAFVDEAAGSQRAGEVLGAVLLHTWLTEGPARAAVAAMGSLPFVARGVDHYLRRRLRAHPDGGGRAGLLDAYAASALTVGAQRAANWYRAALEQVLEPPETGAPSAPPQANTH